MESTCNWKSEEGNFLKAEQDTGIKDSWRETCEETLGGKTKQHEAYASVDALNKIEVRKKAKEVLNPSKTRVRKAEAQAKYPEANKEV